MIDFKVNGGDLSKAVFGGSVEDLSAEICMMISMLYGALCESDKDGAKQFHRNMIACVTDPEISAKVFSDELVKSIKDSGGAEIKSEKIDKEEIIKQAIKELLDL